MKWDGTKLKCRVEDAGRHDGLPAACAKRHGFSQPPQMKDEKMTDDQIKHMVERFLQWRLPDDFSPDAGISFEPTYKSVAQQDVPHEPTGTNLLNYSQAKAMVEHMLEGLPSP